MRSRRAAAGHLKGRPEGIRLPRKADARRAARAPPHGLAPIAPQNLHRSLDQVFECRHMRKQIEALEHHAGFEALAGDLVLGRADRAAPCRGEAHELAIEQMAPRIDRDQLVDAAKQRRLAGARGADDANHLAGLPHRARRRQGLGRYRSSSHIPDGDERPIHQRLPISSWPRPARNGARAASAEESGRRR